MNEPQSDSLSTESAEPEENDGLSETEGSLESQENEDGPGHSTNLVVAPLTPPALSRPAGPGLDLDLVRRARDGDVEAFEALYHAWHRRIYNLVLQYLGNENDAADLTQDVFVKLFEALPTLRVEEAFVSFLYRMAINLCRDQYRRRSRFAQGSLDQPRGSEDEDGPDFEIADRTHDPQEALETAELQKRVREVINTLSDDHRTVILLHHFQDLELVDIAKIMGCAEGTVKSRLARARDEIKRKLRTYIT